MMLFCTFLQALQMYYFLKMFCRHKNVINVTFRKFGICCKIEKIRKKHNFGIHSQTRIKTIVLENCE